MTDQNSSVTLLITDDKLKALVTIRDETLFNEEVINKLLKEKGIKVGIDQHLINDLVTNPSRGTYVIAQGHPPREGRDGYVDYFVTKASIAQDQDQAPVDFREVFNVPSVGPNTLLAVYHPMDPGENGLTVTGQVLTPRPTIELSLRAGKGTVLGPDGKSVFSDTNGRPVIKKQGKNVTVSIESVYKHQGDVDIKSGNLRFNGDVLVSGNVTENMIVDVTGNLKVMGFASRADINVRGYLEVLKVITSCQVHVGGERALFSNIGPKLYDVHRGVKQLDTAATQLQKKAQKTNPNIKYGQLVLALLDKKFTKLNLQIQDLSKLINKIKKQQLPPELAEVNKALACMSGIKALKLENLKDIEQCLKKAVDVLDPSPQGPSNLLAYGIWNSNVTTTGKIIVTGQGVFNSKLHALTSIDIKGVLRGGEIFARENIKVGEIGGAMGVKTIVRTEQGGTIKASRVFNGSILQIGSRIFTANQDHDMVLARINEEGDLVLR